MGYRLRLGRIAKTEREKYRGKTLEEAQAMMDEDEALYRPHAHTQLYEIGKYVNFSEGAEPFYDFELDEDEFKIVNKEWLKALIQEYHDRIWYTYASLAKGEGECLEDPDAPRKFLLKRAREWGRSFNLLPYYLDQPPEKCDGFLVSSWDIEYAIFNLVYIYRTFDWEKDYLIYSGW
jgi:hypothetical protein